jgi:hypothetical protein
MSKGECCAERRGVDEEHTCCTQSMMKSGGDWPPHAYELTEETFLLDAQEPPSSDYTLYLSSALLIFFLLLLVGSLGGTLALAVQLSFAASYVWLALVAIMVIVHCAVLLLIKSMYILCCF